MNKRPTSPSDVTLTVSQINQKIGETISAGFPDPFWVTGEIQGYDRDAAKAPTRRWGQVYFELVEKEKGSDSAKASLKAILWGDAQATIVQRLRSTSDKLTLRDGLQVKFLCAVDFYWPRASLQMKILDVDPEFTLGDLERARQELLKNLKEKGLFDRNRSVLFPPLPGNIGLITSEGSAAYHDFTDELKRSGYAFRVRLWDARMQGEETEASVCRGIALLEGDPEVDVIVLVRGGGSRSDLIWFDKEKIAYAV
ncbi:MAG TPA: exodeoxyribonuclease VII large subunit, partial [Elusimicrobiota bacterium]|nr:exodeoxyribonuclease VII large subunit [Elusimicrobiota bacterium]